jgi:hypothetical protein
MKRDKFDLVVSDLARVRANFTCERCSEVDPDGQMKFKSTRMDASHFYGRGTGNIARYSITNVRCLCKTCHNEVENKPDIHLAFMEDLLGEDAVTELTAKMRAPCKMHKDDKAEMYAFYTEQLKALKKARLDGYEEFIEVVDFF